MEMLEPQLRHNRVRSDRLLRRKRQVLPLVIVLGPILVLLVPEDSRGAMVVALLAAAGGAFGYIEMRGILIFRQDLRERRERHSSGSTGEVKPGDVLELNAPDGVIYAQYLGMHPVYGDAIAVCPVKHTNPVSVDPALFRAGYVTFYPATVAVARGLATVVAHLPSPGLCVALVHAMDEKWQRGSSKDPRERS